MSRPWMPFYVADYVSDTMHLSTIEHGAYLLLIMHYWKNGGLPTDDRGLARITRLSDRQWMAMRDRIAGFFDDQWRHGRIDIELQKSEQKSEIRAEAGARGGKAKALKNNKPVQAIDTPELEQNPTFALASSSQSQSDSKKSSLRSERKSAEESFDEFWKIYPKRDGTNSKAQARKKFVSHVLAGVDPGEIIAGAKRYAEHRRGEEPRFTKQATSWLNGDHWHDDYGPPRRPTERPPPQRGRAAASETLARIINGEFSDVMGFHDDARPTDDAEPLQLGFLGG